MKLLFDEDLVEAVVFLCASGKCANAPVLQVRRFHIERERLYKILDPDERNEAFFKLHLEWFREWTVEKFLGDTAAKFPLLEKHLAGLGFRKARTKPEEGAELFVSNESGRRAVVALRAERFATPESLTRLLHHELMHISDMVDPSFAYSPSVRLPGPATTTERAVRERYRLLWDVTIDGRLTALRMETQNSREQRQAEFDRAFSFWTDERRENVFSQLWTGRVPRHEDLMTIASDPRDLAHAQEPLPGAACPLCNFATFEWAPAASLNTRIVEQITAEFPSWQTAHGVCSRCVETYVAVATAIEAG